MGGGSTCAQEDNQGQVESKQGNQRWKTGQEEKSKS